MDRATTLTVSFQLRAMSPTVESIHGRDHTSFVTNSPVHGYTIREQFLHAAKFSRRQMALLYYMIYGHHKLHKCLDKLPLTRGREHFLKRYPGPFPELPLSRDVETFITTLQIENNRLSKAIREREQAQQALLLPVHAELLSRINQRVLQVLITKLVPFTIPGSLDPTDTEPSIGIRLGNSKTTY